MHEYQPYDSRTRSSYEPTPWDEPRCMDCGLPKADLLHAVGSVHTIPARRRLTADDLDHLKGVSL